jgi:hypothetical protein
MAVRNLLLAASTALLAFSSVAASPAQAQRRVDIGSVAQAAIVGGAITGNRKVTQAGAAVLVADQLLNSGGGRGRDQFGIVAGGRNGGGAFFAGGNGEYRNGGGYYQTNAGPNYVNGGGYTATINSRIPELQGLIDSSREFPWFNDQMYQLRLKRIVTNAELQVQRFNMGRLARNADIIGDISRDRNIDVGDILGGNARRLRADAQNVNQQARIINQAARGIDQLNRDFGRRPEYRMNGGGGGRSFQDEPASPVDQRTQICEKRELDFLKKGQELPRADACRKILGR